MFKKLLQLSKDSHSLLQSIPPRKKTGIVFIMALSDGEISGAQELLDSIQCYCARNYEILIVNDCTTDGSADHFSEQGHWIMSNPKKMGYHGLTYTLRRAFKHALQLFEAPYYIKIDPDALLIAPGLFEKLSSFCPTHHEAGLFGNYLYTPTGEDRDFSYWHSIMDMNKDDLKPALKTALDNGYLLGSGIQGGSYCITQACLEKIDELGFLDCWDPQNQGFKITEDHTFTMLVYAAGYTAIDFGFSSGDPFACRFKELAMSPDELIKDGRILIHPIKYHDELSLAYRKYFRTRREK